MSGHEKAVETLIRQWVYEEEKKILEHLQAMKLKAEKEIEELKGKAAA